MSKCSLLAIFCFSNCLLAAVIQCPAGENYQTTLLLPPSELLPVDYQRNIVFFSGEFTSSRPTTPNSVLAMAQKRKLTEDFDIVSAATPADSANIHGVVSSFSPIKKGKRTDFFEAKLTDGEQQMRVVGFHESLREKLAKSQDQCKSVSLQNCQVKHGQQSDELEIILKSSSRIQASPQKIVVDDMLRTASTPEITLDTKNVSIK